MEGKNNSRKLSEERDQTTKLQAQPSVNVEKKNPTITSTPVPY